MHGAGWGEEGEKDWGRERLGGGGGGRYSYVPEVDARFMLDIDKSYTGTTTKQDLLCLHFQLTPLSYYVCM